MPFLIGRDGFILAVWARWRIRSKRRAMNPSAPCIAEHFHPHPACIGVADVLVIPPRAGLVQYEKRYMGTFMKDALVEEYANQVGGAFAPK